MLLLYAMKFRQDGLKQEINETNIETPVQPDTTQMHTGIISS